MTNQRRKSASFHSHKNDLVSSGIEALETRQMLSGTGPVGTSPDTDVSYQQNFEENTDGIQIMTPATTSVFEKLGDHSLQFNDIGRTGLSLATVDLASELPETFLVSTEFEAVSGAGQLGRTLSLSLIIKAKRTSNLLEHLSGKMNGLSASIANRTFRTDGSLSIGMMTIATFEQIMNTIWKFWYLVRQWSYLSMASRLPPMTSAKN